MAESTTATGTSLGWLAQVTLQLEQPPPQRLPPSEARAASVLVPLWVEAGELWTLLVKRAETLRHHRNQYAFPGGGREAGEDAWAAALREAEEELGLPPAKVLKLGQLDEQATPSGFRIVPCVGALPAPKPGQVIVPHPDPGEIAEVFALPVKSFADPQLVEDREVKIDGAKRVIRIYLVNGRQIWGMTARVLQNLLDRLSGPHDWV